MVEKIPDLKSQFIESINNLIFLTPVADFQEIRAYHSPLIGLIDNNPYVERGSMQHKGLHQNMWIIGCGALNGRTYYDSNSKKYLVNRGEAVIDFMSREGNDGRPERFGTEQLRFNVWYDQTYLKDNEAEFSRKEKENTGRKLESVLHKRLDEAVVVI